MIRIGLTLIFALFAGACAPKVQPRHFENPQTSFGPRADDTDLREGLQQSSSLDANVGWEGDLSTAVFMRQAENMMKLGHLTQKPEITKKGMDWVQKFYATSKSTSMILLADSPYLTAATTTSKKDVSDALSDIRFDLEKSKDVLREGVRKVSRNFDWPRHPQRLGSTLQTVENFLNAFLKELPKLNLPELISKSIATAIKKRAQQPLSEAKEFVPKLYSAKTLSATLKIINRAIDSFNMSLPSETRKMLAESKKLSDELDSAYNEQAVLTALITIWRMLEPQERLEQFKPTSDALYTFLKEQSEAELSCLATPGCLGGPIDGIKKKLFVLPQIKKYGVDNIRNQLNASTVKYALETIESNAADTVKDLPSLLTENLKDGITEQSSQIKKIQKDYTSFLRDLLKIWAAKKIPETKGQIAGFENPRVNVSLSEKSGFSIKATGDLSQVSNETTGASFAALSTLFAQDSVDDKFVFKSSLSQINKMLALGGYRTEDNNLVPAFFAPMKDLKNQLDLMTFASETESFAATDIVSVKTPFRISDSSSEKNYSVAAMTEQIRGLSSMLNYMSDWKKSKYNDTLGSIKANEVANTDAEELDRSIFPKEAFFALNIADVSVLLKNITKEFSNVFLLNTRGKMAWASDYDFGGADQAIMAGVVDIKDNKRGEAVRGDHVSRLLIAVAEFVRATENIEQTQSAYLLAADQDGVTPIDLLKKGRDDLRMLTVALANFISHQMINKVGLVSSTYRIGSGVPDENASVLNQALAIRALIAARSITNLDIYIWSAQEIYFAMNKHLFSQKERFYNNKDTTNMGFPEKLTTLVALAELYPYLPSKSQMQLDLILKPWLKALSEIP